MIEVDCTDLVHKISPRNYIKFISSPTLKDLEEAYDGNYIIAVRLVGTLDERTNKLNKIRETLGTNYKSPLLFIDNRFPDDMSSEEYENQVINNIQRII